MAGREPLIPAERMMMKMSGRTKLSEKLSVQYPDCDEGYFADNKGFITLYCKECGKPRYDRSHKPLKSGAMVIGFDYTDTIWVRREHSEEDQCECE